MSRHKTHIRPKEQGALVRKPIEQISAAIINNFFQDRQGPILIAIGGPGGTGKSSFAKKMSVLLEDSAILTLDDYKTARTIRQQAKVFGPHPLANKMDLITIHLDMLKQGQAFEKPVYDPEIGDGVNTETFVPKRFNIVEGEVSTYKEFRGIIDFSIFIDSDWHTQLSTRLGRDLTDRGYSLEKAVETFLHSNLWEFSEHGAESKKWADLHLFCHDDYRLELESLSQELYNKVEQILHPELEPLQLCGLVVPLLTPFSEDGTIDLKVYAEHLDWLAEAGVRRVLVGGTTGEFFSLTTEERIVLLKVALEYFPWQVVFHISGETLSETCYLAEEAEQLGADGLLCLPPYYYANVPEKGLIDYFNEVGMLTDLPLILYNHPYHTQNPLTPMICRSVKAFGIKDTSGNQALISETEHYFCGADDLLSLAVQGGACGFISSFANVFPDLYGQMEVAIDNKDWDEVEKIQEQIDEHRQPLEANYEIAMLKKMMGNQLSGYPDHVRLPLIKK